MWRCKYCGGKKFEIILKRIENINCIKRSVMCCNCYIHGEDINDIAYLEEKDEN